MFGAQLHFRMPIASTSAATYVANEVDTVQADIRDERVFANRISHDAFRNTPGSKLLTGLRGKNVLLVFVESYGQVSVQGSSFSPAIDSLLRKGTTQLHTAGFSARSAFVTSPGFGGISWLAHSTLQSGVWANSQRRYDQPGLIYATSNRFSGGSDRRVTTCSRRQSTTLRPTRSGSKTGRANCQIARGGLTMIWRTL